MGIASIGVDLGGTRIKSVSLDMEGNILQELNTPTFEENDLVWKQAAADSIDRLKTSLGPGDFVVGISAPGIPDKRNSAIAHMPGRLKGLENFSWATFISRRTWVLNDAVSALIAEARLGAAKNCKNAILITLGTGVGGAIMIDGKPYQGSFQKAGHLGHFSLDSEGEPDITGMPGSLEDAIGNSTVIRRSLGRFTETSALLAAYRKGDSLAREVWLLSLKKLAIGISGLTNILSPECVIIGGGIAEAGKDLFEPLEEFLSRYEWRAGGHKTVILKSKFGDMAGAIGAACFAQMQDSQK